jgi:hypothetical protein
LAILEDQPSKVVPMSRYPLGRDFRIVEILLRQPLQLEIYIVQTDSKEEDTDQETKNIPTNVQGEGVD